MSMLKITTIKKYLVNAPKGKIFHPDLSLYTEIFGDIDKNNNVEKLGISDIKISLKGHILTWSEETDVEFLFNDEQCLKMFESVLIDEDENF